MSTVTSPSKEQVIDVLRQVNDPELHRDLVSLNMIKNVAICDGHVKVHVELTTPACPLKDRVRDDVATAVRKLEGVREVEVEFSAQVRGGPMRQATLPGVKNVIAVGAGKGGVGKSTVAVLTAIGLARSGAKVGLLDADVYGPSIPKMLGVEDAKPTMADEKMILPIVAHGIKVISIGFFIPPEQAVVWRGPMIHGTIKQFLDQVDWGELDYLVVDLPPGTGDVPLTLSQSIQGMTGAVVVCTPQDVALLDAVRAARMYQQLNVDVLGVVENMSYFIAPDTGKEYDLFGRGGAQRAAADLKVPFLGSIPINVAIRVSGDQGNPQTVFNDSPEGVGQAVTKVVENLAGQISVRNAAKAPPLELKIHR
ncbi:MAG: iron-sulfur cluster carrier protein [Phycisphaerae bacterium]